MSSEHTTPPEDGYFNDLSRQPGQHEGRSESPQDDAGMNDEPAENGAPRPRRIACIICRKRKLKCDGSKPSCSTCSRLRHKCAYDEVRKKSGPKRGYVKELEARLAQVETQLKSKDGTKATAPGRSPSYANSTQPQGPQGAQGSQPNFQINDLDMGLTMEDQDVLRGFLTVPANPSTGQTIPNIISTDEGPMGDGQSFSWEMIGLGLEEPLPPQEMVEELHQVYFEKVHPSVPMMHRYRYFAAMNLSPHMRPPICLRYAMWALACAVNEKYFNYSEVFYQRARKYAELDEMKGHGELFITVGHCQCWTLIATYEFKMMYFPRAWMSTGRSTRLSQMLGLHRLDGMGLEVKQSLPPPRDWTDREERRRTFWCAYCGDRYASIGTGWPMNIEEKDIMTNLPSTEEAFEQSKEEVTLSLNEALTPEGAASLSSLAGVVLMACLFGRNLTHLHRPDTNDSPEDPANGEFWKRHRQLDTILLNTSMYLPEHLRLPAGVRDANIVFLNMNIHTSTICLHQAAILKAEKHKLSMDLIRQSTDRCFLAAGEIVSIMRLISHIDIGNMNPFMAFCLFVAARIFAHSYKKRPGNTTVRNNLEFLLSAMQAGRKKNPLTESFLVQLMVDLDGCGLDMPLNTYPATSIAAKRSATEVYHESTACPPVMQRHSDTQPSFEELHERPPPIPRTSADPNLDPSGRYSMSTFSVPTREQRIPQQQNHAAYAAQGQGHGIISMGGWGDINTSGVNGEAGHNAVFDTEMSSEHASDRQASLSGQPTPTTSQRGSSNTSYSPPRHEDADPSHHNQDISGTGPSGPFYHPSVPFTGFPPTPDHFNGQSRVMVGPESFGVPSGWELGPDGNLVAGNVGPMGESGWTEMLEGMAWDGTGASAGPGWRTTAQMGESRR